MMEEDEKNTITGLIMTGSVFAVIGMFIQFGFAPSLITLGASLIIMGVKR